MLEPPQVLYTRAGDGLNLAYTTFGEGPLDLLWIPGFVSHLEIMFELPQARHYFERLGSFGRVVMYDKRGQGLSDRPPDPPTLEQSMEDARAVLDSAGAERAAVIGVSEGGPMSALLAASYPERISALVLYGTWACAIRKPDYPEGVPVESFERFVEFTLGNWGGPESLGLWAPSASGDAQMQRWWGRLLRSGTSPGGAAALLRLYTEIDVRAALPAITAPTLVLHRRGDRAIRVPNGRAIAALIPGARFIELEGDDHLPVADPDQILDEVEEFLTGQRTPREPDRMLATVMFTDIVGSTGKAAELGDRGWRELVQRHDELVRRAIDGHRGREIKTMGDGFLATFDGPARAIRAAGAARDAVRELGIEIRAGLHTGELEVMGDDVGGIAVNIGARVGALAGPGEVLVSRTVTDLVAGSGIDFEDRGAHALKGVPGEWQLFAARG